MIGFMRVMRGLAAGVLILSAISLLIAVALNLVNIIGRYVFFKPIASAEEVMLFLFVGTVFLGNSVVGFEGKQIRMDILLHAVPPILRHLLDTLADLAVIAVSVIIIVAGWPVIRMLAEFDQRSQVAEIPLFIPQALVPIGLGLNAILVGARLIEGLWNKRRSVSPAGTH